eukprot:6155531-Amphidinium_carterae.1
MGLLSPASLAPSLGSCKYSISRMTFGRTPMISTCLSKVARSCIAMSGNSRSSPMLHRSTPLAFPRGQWSMTFPAIPFWQ